MVYFCLHRRHACVTFCPFFFFLKEIFLQLLGVGSVVKKKKNVCSISSGIDSFLIIFLGMSLSNPFYALGSKVEVVTVT